MYNRFQIKNPLSGIYVNKIITKYEKIKQQLSINSSINHLIIFNFILLIIFF
jgi:hypothetical protein